MRGRGGRGEDAFLRRLHHALPHPAMETYLCFHPSHRTRQRLYYICRFYPLHRGVHCNYRRHCRPPRLLHLPQRLLPLKTRLQTTLLEMLPAPTLSTCSLALETHGPWLPSTGSLRARALLSPSEAWDSL